LVGLVFVKVQGDDIAARAFAVWIASKASVLNRAERVNVCELFPFCLYF
jgi:hypothetical protein